MMDCFSRFCAVVPIPDKSAKTVSTAILTHWIALYGTPIKIRTDAGLEFKNSTIVSMMSSLNVKIKVGTPYSHQSNPVERFHRTLWALLKAKKVNGSLDWEKSLPTLVLAYNATQHYSTLSLLPKFRDDNPAPHLRGGVGPDSRLDEKMQWGSDANSGRIQDQLRTSNSRKLHIFWSGPLQITEIINQAMFRIKE